MIQSTIVFQVEDSKLNLVKILETKGNVNHIKSSNQTGYIAMVTDFDGVFIHNINTFEFMFHLKFQSINSKAKCIGSLNQRNLDFILDCCSFSLDNKYLCASGIDGALIWDLESKENCFFLLTDVMISLCKFSPLDPDLLILMGHGIHWINMSTWSYEYSSIRIQNKSEGGFCFSNCGKQIYYSSGEEIFQIQIHHQPPISVSRDIFCDSNFQFQ
jgi:hypothetical protein